MHCLSAYKSYVDITKLIPSPHFIKRGEKERDYTSLTKLGILQILHGETCLELNPKGAKLTHSSFPPQSLLPTQSRQHEAAGGSELRTQPSSLYSSLRAGRWLLPPPANWQEFICCSASQSGIPQSKESLCSDWKNERKAAQLLCTVWWSLTLLPLQLLWVLRGKRKELSENNNTESKEGKTGTVVIRRSCIPTVNINIIF